MPTLKKLVPCLAGHERCCTFLRPHVCVDLLRGQAFAKHVETSGRMTLSAFNDAHHIAHRVPRTAVLLGIGARPTAGRVVQSCKPLPATKQWEAIGWHCCRIGRNDQRQISEIAQNQSHVLEEAPTR